MYFTAMASTLGFALLALLARRPQTGYQLRQTMSEPVGFYWSAAHSQIYPELARLETAGQIRHEVIDGPGPRDTKRYRITPAGRRALAVWSIQPPSVVRERDELMIKISALWTAPQGAVRELVAGELTAHQERLARYRRSEAQFHAEPTDPVSPEFAAYATLRCGLSYEQHRIAWCEWLLARLEPGTR